MKNLKIRLYPTEEQEILFKKFIGAERYIYNWALSLNNELYKNEKRKYSINDLSKKLTQHKKEKLWINKISNANLKAKKIQKNVSIVDMIIFISKIM